MNEVLNLHEASKVSGKSLATVRRWARESLIEAKKNSSGHWEIPTRKFKAYLAHNVNLHEASMDTHSEVQAAQDEASRTLHEALHRERKINDELRAQVKEKDSALLKLTFEMKAMLENKPGGIISRWIRA